MTFNPLNGKNILLGVTGSIAAYKGVDLASKLSQAGAMVDVVLTPAAEKFILPLTFQSVTGRRAYVDRDLWGGEGHVTHIAIGHAAHLVLIAPASANTIAKLANGIADNLLTVASLASTCPILLAPAMDGGMFLNPATQENLDRLKQRGVQFIGPAAGHLASGLSGIGRMSEPVEILSTARWLLGRNGPLAGKKVVVSAGGTQEAIDPVRVITNRSSGRQGYAIAQAAIDAGADVVLITTPVSLTAPAGCRVISICTAQELLTAVLAECKDAHALIMAAAPADFRPKTTAAEKIKKRSGFTTIELEPTSDILAEVAAQKPNTGGPKYSIGFAAESQNLVDNAVEKLHKKSLDMIVANNISEPGSGFEGDTNRVIFLFSDGSRREYPRQQKTEVAEAIIAQVIAWG